MKVWDENWETTNDDGGIVTTVDGFRGQKAMPAIFIVCKPTELATNQSARARLASAAPAMARLLLRLQNVYQGDDIGTACIMCGCDALGAGEPVNHHYEDCELRRVLRAAGVLP